MKQNLIIWGLSVLMTAILFLGCHQKTVFTSGKPSVIGVVTVDEDSIVGTEVEVSGSRLLPVVAINDETLALQNFHSSGEYGWYSSWKKAPLRLNPGNRCILNVYQSDGDAQSDSLVIPLPPAITFPTESFLLQKGNSLPIRWTITSGLTQCYLKIYLEYYYYDTAGDYNYFSLDTSLYLPGDVNSFTLPSVAIFPAQVNQVLYGGGEIYLELEAGPRMGREVKGNIKGNGCGYFWTISTNRCWFDVGEGVAQATVRKLTVPELTKGFLERRMEEMARP